MSRNFWRVMLAYCVLSLAACSAPAPANTPTRAPSMTPTLPDESLAMVLTVVAGQTAAPPSATPSPTVIPPTVTVTSRPSGGGQVQPQPSAQPPSATLAATQPPPLPSGFTIESFTASATSVRPGDTIALAWKTNAGQVSIRVIYYTGQYGPWFDQPGTSSMSYTVDPNERNAFQIQLVAGPNGTDPYKNLVFSIICPDRWFLNGAPATCPNPALKGDWVAERFEHGAMYWIGGNGTIVVVRDQNSWGVYSDTWGPGMPESDPTLTPPAGLYQPLRGFGTVWRDSERDSLGWATAPEFATTITYQCDSVFKSAVCILAGPDGTLILNIWGGGWKKFTGS